VWILKTVFSCLIVKKNLSDINKRRSWLVPPDINIAAGNQSEGLVTGPLASGRRGRFIVLGSSGECLPVTRSALSQCGSNSLYSSCNSSVDEEFHSATASGEGEF
jgi:poly(ADP-ribose) glycohydrolase